MRIPYKYSEKIILGGRKTVKIEYLDVIVWLCVISFFMVKKFTRGIFRKFLKWKFAVVRYLDWCFANWRCETKKIWYSFWIFTFQAVHTSHRFRSKQSNSFYKLRYLDWCSCKIWVISTIIIPTLRSWIWFKSKSECQNTILNKKRQKWYNFLLTWRYPKRYSMWMCIMVASIHTAVIMKQFVRSKS